MNDLTEEDLNEFNEQPLNDDDQGNLKGYDDEHNGENVNFNENTGFKDPQLYKGMRFTSADIFRKALQKWVVKRGFSYTLNKINKERVFAICKDRCGFKIYA